jgi:Site-specific recombinases, DNA invertase Pin homologs
MDEIKYSSIQPIVSRIWNAYGYLRLSHEDGDKKESNSITGQKDLIHDYFNHHPEIIECGMKIDDGFSGSSFDRPAFQEMMADVKAGKINCIVVKDLSRFGRNYLDSGEYIEKIFPFLGVRFIAINDNYDSLNRKTEFDELMIPFKNLINEAYCRDISIKIRSQLETKRRRGDFTGSFAAYGYLKDPENKNRLLIDAFAANVVRDIFCWKIKGLSAGDIAERLNRDGILAPLDYKKSQGLRFATPFGINIHSVWNATTILRILKNPIYTGVLEQGKSTTPSFKVKRRILKPREEWSIVRGAHKAVIAQNDFEIVQKLLAMDTRTSPKSNVVELFSGIVYCGECGAAMVRKTVPSGKKKYIYYVCAAHKNEKTCYAHSLRDSILEGIILESVKRQVQSVLGMEKVLELIKMATLQQADMKKYQERLDKKNGEISRYKKLLCSLYENVMDGVIDKEEYQKLKKNYTGLLSEAQKRAKIIRTEIRQIMESNMEEKNWLDQLKKYQNFTVLDRAVVVCLIEKILVYKNKQVEIVYNWQEEYHWLANLLLQTQDNI